ncbi:MAG: endonuclease [Succinivibrio sp.]
MRFSIKICIAVCLFLLNSAQAQINSYRQARVAMVDIFRQLDAPVTTLYCGCNIIFTKNGYKPDLESCGYKIRKNAKRAQRIEAEHIMSAWEFGHNRQCWKQGRRKGCNSTDETFNRIEADLHNLYPAIGEVNADRSNFMFSSDSAKGSPYGRCQMIIDRSRQRVTPPEGARGIVARAYLYMSEKYSIPLDKEHINLFNRWNKAYPPSKNECRRNRLIAQIQGNDNRFVTQKCR